MMIWMLSGLVVLATISLIGFIALWAQGDLDDIIHGHRCTPYCSPGSHHHERKRK